MSPRAVIVHLSEPLWAHARDIELWRRDVFQPVMDAVFASSGPIGLVLGGRLAERLASSDPDRAAALRSRVASGQVELVATALHAACLSSIPREDAKGQLRAHITVLRRAFGARPEGCWVPFQAWDPSLPRVLRKAGLSWATLDDAWLRRVGAPNAEALALEREGHAIIGLRGRPDGNGLVLLDPHDVESTAHALAALALPRDPIAMLLALPRARAYLPTGGPEGLWETRLLQDAGADALHKRMLRVSRLVRRLERTVEGSTYTDDGPDPMRLEQANRYLYRAQSGVAYGGASCSTAIRDRAWRDLIRAEAVAGGELALPVPACTTADLDCDGEDEVRLRTEAWSVTVAPASNGALVEIVRNREAVNVLSGMLPLAFRETWGSGTPVADRWELVTTEVPGEGLARVVLMADSALEGVPVRLTKGIQIGPKGPLALRLEVHNRGMEAARGRLATELFLSLGGRRWCGDDSEPLAVELGGGKEPLDETVELPPVDALGIAGWRSRVDIDLRPAASVVVEPLTDGLVRVELSWSVELFVRDRERREVLMTVREVPDA